MVASELTQACLRSFGYLVRLGDVGPLVEKQHKYLEVPIEARLDERGPSSLP